MTYACPAWKLAADICLLKLQRLQNKLLRIIGIFQSGHQSAICTQLSTFRVYAII
jgi:hypothetical protein